MTMFTRVRRMLTVLAAGAAIAAGVTVGAAPAQATVTPFALSLTAVHSNLVLAESSNVPGAAVVQRKPDSQPASARQWRLDFVAAATARLVNVEFPGMCMQPEKALEASIVRMRPCDGTVVAQVWQDHLRTFNGQTVHEWHNLASHMCLDVNEASQSPEALVIQFPCTGGANQLFKQAVV
ncbi:ricin-type beta-trefoil lectin domain protein [Dactylosporangium aurantiacum]|uniref:Ricin-type beta-trefoil lectin domain protein n=1 Tax=Dactylosporangium aurantiacum TaxID=35754 RepID=A0A9Q9I8T7_9ACTN|nr:RICIN domain-containing protein [Dactylosporangium aurantiacum]MDG6109575.1 RICIN domain-containing protein [Dactylosporangium aurantiacum]UWZ51271.1 ricin-type beta-trefoil lectin domain protein [Dactylosporangium aurantiacum]